MENETMSDTIKHLTEMLSNDSIPENLKDILSQLNTNSNDSSDVSHHSSTSDSSSSSPPEISPETLSTLLGMVQSNSSHDSSSSESSHSTNATIDLEMLMKLKAILEKVNHPKEDPRSNLLLSLKPYLNESRQSKVEQYIRLFNMSKVMEVLNESGGDQPHA